MMPTWIVGHPPAPGVTLGTPARNTSVVSFRTGSHRKHAGQWAVIQNNNTHCSHPSRSLLFTLTRPTPLCLTHPVIIHTRPTHGQRRRFSHSPGLWRLTHGARCKQCLACSVAACSQLCHPWSTFPSSEIPPPDDHRSNPNTPARSSAHHALPPRERLGHASTPPLSHYEPRLSTNHLSTYQPPYPTSITPIINPPYTGRSSPPLFKTKPAEHRHIPVRSG